jgi:hypothetical protein
VIGNRQERDFPVLGLFNDLFNREGAVGAFRVDVQVDFHG